jgi:hypothetical protein
VDSVIALALLFLTHAQFACDSVVMQAKCLIVADHPIGQSHSPQTHRFHDAVDAWHFALAASTEQCDPDTSASQFIHLMPCGGADPRQPEALRKTVQEIQVLSSKMLVD